MAECPSCKNEVTPGTRWCGICHGNVVRPDIGRLSSPGKRLGAYSLDVAIPLFTIFFVVPAAVGVGGSSGSDGATTAGVLLGLLLPLAYVVWALVLFSRGTTPGKRLLGMTVVREDGSRAGFLIMLVREWVGKLISGMIFSLGFLWILFDRENQGWHDKLVSTYVVD